MDMETYPARRTLDDLDCSWSDVIPPRANGPAICAQWTCDRTPRQSPKRARGTVRHRRVNPNAVEGGELRCWETNSHGSELEESKERDAETVVACRDMVALLKSSTQPSLLQIIVSLGLTNNQLRASAPFGLGLELDDRPTLCPYSGADHLLPGHGSALSPARCCPAPLKKAGGQKCIATACDQLRHAACKHAFDCLSTLVAGSRREL
jgi:hypothetical protein